jgi:hypothetical protein
MKFKLDASDAQLVHILRSLMFHRDLDALEVLSRTWEFQYLCAGPEYDFTSCQTKLFPENPDQKTPFKLTGERLLERSALIQDFEETIVFRYSLTKPDKYDLAILLDTGNTVIYTDDENTYNALKSRFDHLESTCTNFSFQLW